jgi:hypothetical protein
MDLMDSIKLISIPVWVKWLIIFGVSLVGLVNIGVFSIGLLEDHREWWIHASIDLASVVMPIFIVSLLLIFSDAGVDSLIRNTEKIITGLLPKVLENVSDGKPLFYDPVISKSQKRITNKSKVFINFQQSECHGDLVIFVPVEREGKSYYRELMIRVEINVFKINFDLCLVRDHLLAQLGLSGEAGIANDALLQRTADKLLSMVRHTVGGAREGSRADTRAKENAAGAHGGGAESDPAQVAQGYRFNLDLLERRMNGVDYLCLVAARHFPKDFLWDSAEKLFFAQDLMLMLRAFVTERPELFRAVSEEQFREMIR